MNLQAHQTTRLTKREIEIAEAYASGANYQSVSHQLCIAPSTVRTHLAAIYRKLGVSSKIELHTALRDEVWGRRHQADTASIISELARNLEDALRRERAVAEVLSIISRSQGDLDAVIKAVLSHALALCNAEYGVLFRHAETFSFEAQFMLGIPKPFADWLLGQGVFRVGPKTGLGRVVEHHEVVNITDVRAEDLYVRGDPLRDATADLGKARSFTAIPMLVGDRLIGAFTIYRQQLRPFDDQALDIARVFADQSVIAIENARLIGAVRKAAS